MWKFFFIGDTRNNSGPSNVNKGITANLSFEFSYMHCRNKICKIIESIYKTLLCKVVVISGISGYGVYMAKVAKLLHKKCIYIMHGCIGLEIELNHFLKDEKALQNENILLEKADLILPVSYKYSLRMKERFPKYKEKFKYLHNGVMKIQVDERGIVRKKGTIIAVGGDRKQKNNITIAKAIKKLEGDIKLYVYGYIYNPGNLPKYANIEFKGLVSQEQLYREMMASEVFVLNSICESFALSVFDALFCGCSILVSNEAGVLEVLNIMDNDIIYDPMNENEIAEKISYVLQHPNNERIRENLDLDVLSYKSECKKLEIFCNDLIQS